MIPVRVIVVNYGTADLAVECLESVERAGSRLARVHAVIVDNHSPDDSVSRIKHAIGKRRWQAWVELIPSPRNGGFGAGNNAGIRHVSVQSPRPDFFWLLNPDTVAAPDALDALLRAMLADPSAAVCGSKILSPQDEPTEGAHVFPCPMTELVSSAHAPWLTSRISTTTVPLESERLARCDWVCAASALFRAAALDAIGLFDEEFFLYFEEVDLCKRAAAAGWHALLEPRSRVTHIGRCSTQIDLLGRFPSYWFESRRRYFLKHKGPLYLALADLAWISGCCVRRIRRWRTRGSCSPPFPLHYTRDLVKGDCRAVFGFQAAARRASLMNFSTPVP